MIVSFPGTTTQDIPVEQVLDAAKGLKHVLVLGRDEAGDLVAASSTADNGWSVLVIEEFKHKLLAGHYAHV